MFCFAFLLFLRSYRSLSALLFVAFPLSPLNLFVMCRSSILSLPSLFLILSIVYHLSVAIYQAIQFLFTLLFLSCFYLRFAGILLETFLRTAVFRGSLRLCLSVLFAGRWLVVYLFLGGETRPTFGTPRQSWEFFVICFRRFPARCVLIKWIIEGKKRQRNI